MGVGWGFFLVLLGDWVGVDTTCYLCLMHMPIYNTYKMVQAGIEICQQPNKMMILSYWNSGITREEENWENERFYLI